MAAAAAVSMAASGTRRRATAEDRAGVGDPAPERNGLITLFLAGDVMVGRGIDQILPHPGESRIYEPYLNSAVQYVALAEQASGPIPRPVDFGYVWGDALAEIDRRRPDLRLVNLETAITASGKPMPKGINYKMNPENLPVLTAAKLDCCTLANNHTLDWGEKGLEDTLDSLQRAGIKAAGAGRNLREAAALAILPVGGQARVLVFAFGSATSGIPRAWAATDQRPGVNLLPDLSSRTVRSIAGAVRAAKKPGDVTVASIHWGGNWGYEIPEDQRAFAHGLIDDAGLDVVFGHSSHHVKAIEVYRGKPILYGCGDLLNDYEGIGGYEDFRDDLVLTYFPSIRPSDGSLFQLTMVPFRIRKFRIDRVSSADAAWVCDTLNREGRQFGTAVRQNPDSSLTLSWN